MVTNFEEALFAQKINITTEKLFQVNRKEAQNMKKCFKNIFEKEI